MFHPITQRCWVPLALVAMLCGVVALVSPSAVGAQEAPALEVSLTGNCAATVADTFTYTLTVTNNGADPIDVVALDQSFTVAAGATGTAEFLEDDVSSGLVNSITIDGMPAEGVVFVTPSCVALDPPPSSSVEPPSSSHEPPSSGNDATPVSAPLPPNFTG